jgi:hypothetical protein
MPNTGTRPQWSCHGHSHAGFFTGVPTKIDGVVTGNRIAASAV